MQGPSDAGGAIIHRHVDDVAQTLDTLRPMGAEEHEEQKDRGSGFVTASVVDPLGNVPGIMHNPHYLEIQRTNLPGS
ncbi:VOC family protein [Streptomyces sp. NPDC057445]|uniref:VOC family protein n=1 Tax=Streptomyces sp. NPDC057445 TaxID=3346136 RepID=UPI00368C029C